MASPSWLTRTMRSVGAETARSHPVGTPARGSGRPGLLGRTELDGQTPLDRRKGLDPGRRRPGRGHARGRPSPRRARLSANPYVPTGPARSRSTGFSVNLGVFVLLVCGIALMYGSVGPWVHVTGSVGVADLRVSVNGIDPAVTTLIGINGWATFIGGILIAIFACFEMTSEELQLSIFTTLITGVTTVFAVYDMFRIVQKISQVPSTSAADVSVGWGLICVLSAAVLALLVALVRLIQR